MAGRRNVLDCRRSRCFSRAWDHHLVITRAVATLNDVSWNDWVYRVTTCYTFCRHDYTPLPEGDFDHRANARAPHATHDRRRYFCGTLGLLSAYEYSWHNTDHKWNVFARPFQQSSDQQVSLEVLGVLLLWGSTRFCDRDPPISQDSLHEPSHALLIVVLHNHPTSSNLTSANPASNLQGMAVVRLSKTEGGYRIPVRCRNDSPWGKPMAKWKRIRNTRPLVTTLFTATDNTYRSRDI